MNLDTQPKIYCVGHYGRCSRSVREDGMRCWQHQQAKDRADYFQALRDRQDAQRAFVVAWRSEHPVQAFTQPYICPLCGQAIQTIERGVAFDVQDTKTVMSRLIESHNDQHGEDWARARALGGKGEGE